MNRLFNNKLATRVVAIVLAFVMIISFAGINGADSYAATNDTSFSISPTWISTAESGHTMFYEIGSYSNANQAVVNRINEIRYEACHAGNVPDPRNEKRMLQPSDYVPIKWSPILEQTARWRAAENGLSYSLFGTGHKNLTSRPSEIFYERQGTGYNVGLGENIAYYHHDDFVEGINMWYGEKEDYLKKTGAVVGHYTSMINPDFTYVGMGLFHNEELYFKYILNAHFSTNKSGIDGAFMNAQGEVYQEIEVYNGYINGYYINGNANMFKGDTQKCEIRVKVKANGGEESLWVKDNVTYTSSNPSVARVKTGVFNKPSTFTIEALSEGTTTFTASINGKSVATFKVTVTCNHSYSLASEVKPTCVKAGSKTYKCSKCPSTKVDTVAMVPHNYVMGTPNSSGIATGKCSVCGGTTTEYVPTEFSTYFINSEVNDGYMWSYVPKVNPVGSTITMGTYYTSSTSSYAGFTATVGDTSLLEITKVDDRMSEGRSFIDFKVKKAGATTITVYPKYNPSSKLTYNIILGGNGSLSIANATISIPQTSYAYTGTAIKPTPTVTYNGVTLKSGTDYTVTYSNNTSIGTGKVTITGTGTFSGSVSKTFTIDANNISSYVIIYGENICNGKGGIVRPKIYVKKDATYVTSLKEGVDYTLTYKDDATTGKCKVTVTGCGTYSGTLTSEYNYNHVIKTTYTWSSDYTSCKMSLACQNPACGAKSPNLMMSVNYQDTVSPTCLSYGKRVYTASLNYVGTMYKDTRTVTLDKTAHSYTEKLANADTMKSAATTVSPAVYYYSCENCYAINKSAGVATFTSGSALSKPSTGATNTSTNTSTGATNTNNSTSTGATNSNTINWSWSSSSSSNSWNSYSDLLWPSLGNNTQSSDVNVYYTTHVQSYGWQGDVNNYSTWRKNGATAGTSGESKRLEAIKIVVKGNNNLGISYRTHIQSYGWESRYATNGSMSGTSGEAKRLEAISIKLTGSDASKYDVYYRVHAQSYGWLGWAKNGENAGTAGQGKRLEGIQILVLKKGQLPTTGTIGYSYIELGKSAHNTSNAGMINYSTHVQSYGDQSYVYDGSISGTTGEAKRLEGIRINYNSSLTGVSGGVMYTTQVQSKGWLNDVNNTNTWSKDGAYSGTSGEGKRLEAIKIKLYGDAANKYDIYYRVHSQSYGWLGWAKNGETAGTIGLGKRLESIQIVIVPKGQGAPNYLPGNAGMPASVK